MLCRKCHKNLATVRYAEVVDGKVVDLYLCPECLSSYQDQGAQGFELSGPVPSPRRHHHISQAESESLFSGSCPQCGTQFVAVMQAGMVGCSQCYGAFGDKMESLLEGIHMGMRHRGKTPALEDAQVKLHADLQTKRALLRSALSAENYEDAAKLRDAIKDLETRLGAHVSAGTPE